MKGWAIVVGVVLAFAVQAAPAPWYQWQSLATGRYMCTQVDPGNGWVRHSGPYNNAGCRTY